MKKRILILALVAVVLICTVVSQHFSELGPNLAPPSLVVEGTLYYRSSTVAPTPADPQILGTIQSHVPSTQTPIENDQSNFVDCLNQPYTMVDGVLLIRTAKGVWYSCTPADQP